jgi:hypothetical protein
MTTFSGIVATGVKTNTNYLINNAGGSYAVDEPTAVFQRGKITVVCTYGDPSPNGNVYVRTVANANGEVGALEATSDTGNNVLLTNAKWQNIADTNGVATLVILTQATA